MLKKKLFLMMLYIRRNHGIDLSDYEYTVIDSVANLNKYIGDGTDVIVPSVK